MGSLGLRAWVSIYYERVRLDGALVIGADWALGESLVDAGLVKYAGAR